MTAQAQRSTRALVRNQKGMTLIEIMIVLAIMAGVMAGVMVAVSNGMKNARISEAGARSSAISSAVLMMRVQNPRATPSVSDLVSRGLLDASQAQDPWGNEYRVDYNGQNVIIVSAGPDGTFGNEDDVRTGGESN